MKEQNRVIQWIKAHKKELALVGFSVAVLIALVVCIWNKDALKALLASLKTAVEPAGKKIVDTIAVTAPEIAETAPVVLLSDNPSIPIEVRRHIRNLPHGWHASLEKQIAALANNIILKDGQTWVEAYKKGVSAVA